MGGTKVVDIEGIAIPKLTSLYKDKSVSVKEVVQQYLERIMELDQGAKGLNSILEVNPDALQIAERLDTISVENRTSKLFGVPILLKDSINTGDKMHTSAGSLALGNSKAKEDAEIVKILRDKGAVILGKTNMTEFANYMTKGMPAGYSSRGGQVISPYKKDASPSGSSTGSAVAVAANLCTVSIGTDTSGSIISPSNKNGIVGFRPSIGSLSNKGIIPISFTLDMPGPMARNVRDAAILFYELRSKEYDIDEKLSLLDINIGLDLQDFEQMSEEEIKKAKNILQLIEKSGAKLSKIKLPSTYNKVIETIKKYEFKYAINRYLSELPKEYPIRTLKDIIEFNIKHEAEALRYGQTYLIEAEEETMGNLSENEYVEALKEREKVKGQLQEQLKDLHLCIHFKEKLVLQLTGFPILSIPYGLYNDGMPYGLYLTGKTNSELLRYGRAIEELLSREEIEKI